MIQLGIVTYNIAKDWDLPTILTRLETLKYEGVELRTTHAHKVEVNLTAAAAARGPEAVRRLARRARRARQRVRVPVDRPGRRPEEHRGDQGIRPARPRHRLARREGPAQRHPQGGRPRRHAPPDRPGPARGRRGRRRASASRSASRSTAAITQLVPNFAKIIAVRRPSQRLRLLELEPDRRRSTARSSENFALVAPKIREVHLRDLTDETYPWRELFALLAAQDYDGYTLAEIPESPDPDRVLRYFRALWLAYQPGSRLTDAYAVIVDCYSPINFAIRVRTRGPKRTSRMAPFITERLTAPGSGARSSQASSRSSTGRQGATTTG